MSKFLASSLLALLTTTGTVAVAAPGEAVEGRWLTQAKSAVVEIYRCGDGELCGRLIWFRMKPTEQGYNPQALDIHNPRPALRERPLCGLIILWGLHPDGSNQWSDGSLYDPESGNTYSGTIALTPSGTLSLRGYVVISVLGRSEEWTRFAHTITRCPTE